MEKLIITKNDLNDNNEYKEDSIDFDGAIIFEENLGIVKIKKSLKASTYIEAKIGSGIEAGGGIEAGDGIEAGWSVLTRLSGGLKASFVSCLRICVGIDIEEEQMIEASIKKGVVLLGKVVEPKKVCLEDLSKEELIKKIRKEE